MAAAKRGGPRVPVSIGQAKDSSGKNRKVYSYVRKAVADQLGLKAEKPYTTVTRGKNKYQLKLRGCRSNAIKIPVGKTTPKKKGARPVYKFVSVPVGQLPLTQVEAFVKKLKNKPEFFVSPDGRWHPIVK